MKTLNYLETLRGEKQISSDAFGGDGGDKYMNAGGIGAGQKIPRKEYFKSPKSTHPVYVVTPFTLVLGNAGNFMFKAGDVIWTGNEFDTTKEVGVVDMGNRVRFRYLTGVSGRPKMVIKDDFLKVATIYGKKVVRLRDIVKNATVEKNLNLKSEGLFMNELIDGKPVGVTDPAIHDGGFDANAGKNPPEAGEMHIGFKMGGGAYSEDTGELKQVGAYAPETKGLSKSDVLGMPSYQIAGISAIGGVATAFALIRYTKVKSWEAVMIGVLAGTGAYFLSDKIINKKTK